ncbi:MAG: hypothetical protein IJF49_09025 [Clostridia bacterium]|nr:hypothetical protein [Clostridia bacterium]
MTLTEKAAYLKGLAEGTALDAAKPETKLINAMLDLIGDLTEALDRLEETTDTLHDYIEEIDEDLGEVEEFIMDEFGDDDCDCDCCCDDDDDEDDEYYEITCPSCGEVICFDETVDPADLVCPACHEHFDCICDCDACAECCEDEEEDDE